MVSFDNHRRVTCTPENPQSNDTPCYAGRFLPVQTRSPHNSACGVFGIAVRFYTFEAIDTAIATANSINMA
jgi:hypothetical protein